MRVSTTGRRPVACRSPSPPAAEGVKRLVLCSGKLYYELADKRSELGSEEDIAIVRVEQVRYSGADISYM